DYMGVPAAGIKSAIEQFTGAGRRFEFIGKFGGFMLADDYAHHPTEIAATLTAAKELDYNRVIAVFQPFTFSRTAMLLNDFINSLSIADEVILLPILGSREKNVYGISSSDIAKGLKNCTLTTTHDDTAQTILAHAGDGDLVITMGGGDVYKACHIIENQFK
ncbi:MAG: UDP-N-acetylmuramate--L-alanine ligase, partial [Clostridiales bacterium]|nr:UDP-N-acetylmuramate--L-alanine ligase [Candidatus Equinaster intestinalis]